MTELIPFDSRHSYEFFKLTDKNRNYLRKWLPWLDLIKSEKDTAEFLRKSLITDLEGTSLNYFIIQDKNIIGTIGLRDITQEKAIIGYWIDEDQQGKNITSQSLQTLIKNVQNKKITQSIILRCSPTNIASSTVARKCGFKYIKTLKDAENLYGKYNDLDVYEYYLT
ncbi:MAG: GNAT family N-acetyltransferase [Neisseriaceae bacterium]|nr:MAG: GNAT family N-acetyltransferase [Neisseriaceae bacterium]